MEFPDKRRRAQSIAEVLIGVGIAAILIVGAIGIITPALRTSSSVEGVQAETETANEFSSNIRAWAAGNWNNILGLATGTANTYYLNTATSSVTVPGQGSGTTTVSTATITNVQNASTSAEFVNSSFSTDSAQFTSSTTSGNAIIVDLQVDIGGGTPTISCSDPNDVTSTYVLAAMSPSLSNEASAILYSLNIVGGPQPTVTCAFSPSAKYIAMAIHEYSGIVLSGALDATSTNSASNKTAFTTGTSTTAANSELIFGTFADATNGSGDTYTPGSGFTKRIDQGTQTGLVDEDEVWVGAGAVSASMTDAVTRGYVAAMATFEPQTTVTYSPASAPTGTQSIAIGSTTFTRYFYVNDVYRDANGNVTTTASGNNYDPSTKLVTVAVAPSSTNPGTPGALSFSFYLTRGTNDGFTQTSWTGGSGHNGPFTFVGTTFAASNNITISATGSIQLSSGGNSCVL